MPVFQLSDDLIFPPVDLAEPDGLLAYGGDLTPDRLLLAYSDGIFPWYDEPPILWWCPDPRFVLFPNELKISASMKQVLKKGVFTITVNKDFSGVINACRKISRPGQDGTWISEDVIKAYTALHEAGYAHSFECWQNDELVGGFYGIQLGDCFFGESMFSYVSNASKAAFITFVQYAAEKGLRMIDCQIHSAHLASLGARMIPRNEFLQIIKNEK